MTDKSLLLHVCCAPCMTVVFKAFASDGYDVTAYFRNPNIHPLKEWERRFTTFRGYCREKQIKNIYDENYPLEENLMMILEAENRCLACFTDRLRATAQKADELGFKYFSTTLSVSPYQDHELIEQAGEAVSAESNSEFIYKDFTYEYRESIRLSREAGLYRQPYCGCVMSEYERYAKRRSLVKEDTDERCF